MCIIGAILFVILIFTLTTNADKWRRTPEGNCLKDIAREFCLERDMDFNKVYAPIYRSIWTSEDFLCDDRGRAITYSFTINEENKCKRSLI